MAVVAILIRFMYIILYAYTVIWQPILIICAIFSMLIGTLGALYQKKIIRLFAYSAIGHVGFILIGIIVGGVEGIQASIMYGIVYCIMMICVFTIFVSVSRYNMSNGLSIKYIYDFSVIVV